MPYRTEALVDGGVYHVFSKSIAGFKIFNSDEDFSRITDISDYYRLRKPPVRFSFVSDLDEMRTAVRRKEAEHMVHILAYCFMPTHIHYVIQQLHNGGITRFMNTVLKSYSKYLNYKLARLGPLWQGRFSCVRVATDEQLLHLTRYVHLNPVTSYLVERPEDWPASSYAEYIHPGHKRYPLCRYAHMLSINPRTYKAFVDNRIGYQRELAHIKSLVFE